MSKDTEFRPKARKPRGLRDQFAGDVLARRHALDVIRGVYESYGFEPLETSALNMLMRWESFCPMRTAPMRECSRCRTMTNNGWRCAMI